MLFIVKHLLNKYFKQTEHLKHIVRCLLMMESVEKTCLLPLKI